MICYSSVQDCWLFVFDIIRNMILYCFMKSTILFELLWGEIQNHWDLTWMGDRNSYQNVCFHWSLYIFFAWRAGLTKNKKDKNLVWQMNYFLGRQCNFFPCDHTPQVRKKYILVILCYFRFSFCSSHLYFLTLLKTVTG